MTDSTAPGAEQAAWEAALTAIEQEPGVTMVIGGADVGKTTFTRHLVNRLTAAGRRVAVLDADPGQSEIGPPTCAGLAFADRPLAALSELNASALAFIGSTSPGGFVPEHITAVRRLADLAAGMPLVVDTSGYLHGSGARRLLQCEADLLGPRHLVGIHRAGELDGLLAPFARWSRCQVHALRSLPEIGSKPAALRTQRRAMRFAAYFRDAAVQQLAFADVGFIGTWLGCGIPLPAHLLRFINTTLGPPSRVYYAEMSGRHLGLMANRPIPAGSPDLGLAMGQLKAREVTVTAAPRLKHLVVGMEAGSGKLLGLGLIAALDFRRGTIGLLTPVVPASAACILRLGSQRVGPDGADAGSLKPGEL